MDGGLDKLLRQGRVWQAGRGPLTEARGIPSGFAALDACLPSAGWPRAALTELLLDTHGRGELALVLPALIRLCMAAAGGAQPRWVCWVAPPFMPYAPALAARGLPPEYMLVVHPPGQATRGEPLWAAEQALRSGQCCAVLAWADTAGDRHLRRLQLAAEASDAWAVLFRPAAARRQPSPATLRLALDADGLEILKCRGVRPARLSLPLEDAWPGGCPARSG